MFSPLIMLIVIGIMTGIQIGVWSMFPMKLRDIIFANPALAFFINLGGSNLILMFTGVASMVGVCNLGASVMFGGYSYLYKRKKNITGLKLSFRNILGILPIIPNIEVQYDKK